MYQTTDLLAKTERRNVTPDSAGPAGAVIAGRPLLCLTPGGSRTLHNNTTRPVAPPHRPRFPDVVPVAQRAAAGDRAALADLFERYRRLMFWVARRVLRHQEDAEDVAQNCWLLFMTKIGTRSGFDPDRGE